MSLNDSQYCRVILGPTSQLRLTFTSLLELTKIHQVPTMGFWLWHFVSNQSGEESGGQWDSHWDILWAINQVNNQGDNGIHPETFCEQSIWWRIGRSWTGLSIRMEKKKDLYQVHQYLSTTPGPDSRMCFPYTWVTPQLNN